MGVQKGRTTPLPLRSIRFYYTYMGEGASSLRSLNSKGTCAQGRYFFSGLSLFGGFAGEPSSTGHSQLRSSAD